MSNKKVDRFIPIGGMMRVDESWGEGVFVAASDYDELLKAPVPPAGDVEVLGYQATRLKPTGVARLDRPLLSKVSDWGPAFTVIELVDRAHVTRLTAECDGLLTDVALRKAKHIRSCQLAIGKSQLAKYLQSELTKARDALAGMVEYFPEGHSDGECFSVERAKAVLAHQSAPAAKGGNDD